MKNILNLFTLITLMIVSVSCSDILSPKEFKYSDLVGNWKAIFKDSTKDINFAIRENGGILSESTAFSGKVEGMENNLDSTVCFICQSYNFLWLSNSRRVYKFILWRRQI